MFVKWCWLLAVMCRCVLFAVCVHCVRVCVCGVNVLCVFLRALYLRGECTCALLLYASLFVTSQPRRAFLCKACAGRQGLRLLSQGKRMYPQCV